MVAPATVQVTCGTAIDETGDGNAARLFFGNYYTRRSFLDGNLMCGAQGT